MIRRSTSASSAGEVDLVGDRERLDEKLFRLFLAFLSDPDGGQRKHDEQPQLRFRRGQVLLRLAQEALGLVGLALLREDTRQLGLGLGELAVLAERGQQTDRLPQELLGPLEISLLEGDVRHAGQRVREQRRVADLRE